MKRLLIFIFITLISFPIIAQTKDAIIEKHIYAFQQGDYIQGKILGELLLEQYDKQLSFEERSTILLTLSTCYSVIGHEDLALDYLNKMEKLISDVQNDRSLTSAQWIIALGMSYYSLDHNKGLSLLLKGIDIYEEAEEEDSTYASALLLLAYAYEQQIDNMTNIVKRMLPKIFSVTERTAGKNSQEYYNVICLAIDNAIDRNEHENALKYLDEGITLGTEAYNTESRFRFSLLGKRALEHASIGNFESAIKDAKEYSKSLKEFFYTNYKHYDSKELSSNFGYIQGWFCDDIIRISSIVDTPELNRISYDGLLFAKGLFLNTEISKVKETNIEKIKNDSWQHVQNSLKIEEAAIEFISYISRNFFSNTIHYYALIIKPGLDAPHLVQLKDANAIDDELTKKDISQKCKEFWIPLKQELKDVNTVYFSPHSEIHNLPIEHFIPEDMSIKHAYRVSSTRELIQKKKHHSFKSSVVIGGLIYQMTKKDWAQSGACLSALSSEMMAMRSMPDIATLTAHRAGNALEFLPGTKHEADIIVDILHQKNYTPIYLSGIHGTEDSFKLLSGKGISLLHIGTHGYYFQQDESPYLGDAIEDIMNNGHSTVMRSQIALSLSGLFLSGAEDALSGLGQPEGYDDGILTALDIAKMDFSDLDLVVLSACQTGLGKVSYEGVNGLQRGFKIAGANSIIMSLWNVSDKATDLLMRNFYANYVGGKSKTDSFNNAIIIVKQYFPDPKDWAPFVLLDGI